MGGVQFVGLEEMQWDWVPSEWASGGLISIWNKEVLSRVEVLKS